MVFINITGNIATHVFTLDFMLKSADLEAKNLLRYRQHPLPGLPYGPKKDSSMSLL